MVLKVENSQLKVQSNQKSQTPNVKQSIPSRFQPQQGDMNNNSRKASPLIANFEKSKIMQDYRSFSKSYV